MRFFKLSLAASTLVLGVLCAQAAETGTAPTLPMRKAGLWELKTSMDEGNGPREQVLKLCLNDEMEKTTVNASIAQHKEACTSYDIKPAATTTVVEADCIFNKRKVLSTTTMTGDFKTSFEVKINSTTSNPEAKDQSVVIKRTILQTGKYLSDSCGELKPGEAEGPDGKRIMVQ